MPSVLRAAAPGRLLTDLIATPVAMMPAAHLGLIGRLHHGEPRATRPRHGIHGALTPGNRTTAEWMMEDLCDLDGPWSEPIYEVDSATGIGLLEITGPLVKGYDDFTAWYYECASIDRIERALGELANRADLRGLVVSINSPGGMSLGMPELSARLAALAARLPVYTFTADQAASNGMRLAVAGTRFYPTASAIVGCIGTYIAFYNLTKHLEEMGIKLELYRSGPYKAIGLEGKDTTTEEAAFIQGEVVRSNEIFLDFVRARRPDAKDESMQGQWFDGARAVDLGLADGFVTGLPEVVNLLRRKIGV